MRAASLAKQAPKAALLGDVEDGGYILLFIVLGVIVLGIAFYPAQVQALFGTLMNSVFAPVWAFGKGIFNFLWSIVKAVFGPVINGASNAGHWAYNHTIGPVVKGLGL